VIFHVSTTKRKSGGRIITTTIAHAQEAIQALKIAEKHLNTE
jgi:hypothetical protein